MKSFFRAVAGAAVTVAAVLTAVVAPSAAASPETVAAAPAGMEQRAISGPGYTPPPTPDAQGVSAQGAWYGPYTYRNAHAGKCLDIINGSKTSLANAVQYTCLAGRSSQIWWDYIVEMDGYFYERLLGNNNSGLCLHVDGKNVPIRQVGCALLENQLFLTTSGSPRLIKNNNLCMEIQGGSLSNNARIVTWDCHGRAHQIWYKYDV